MTDKTEQPQEKAKDKKAANKGPVARLNELEKRVAELEKRAKK